MILLFLLLLLFTSCHKAKSKYGFENHYMGAREMPQQLFQKDPNLIPSTQIVAHSHLLSSVPGALMSSSGLWGNRHTCGT